MKRGRHFRHFVPVPGELKPFVFQRDERPASAFEIIGLKVGTSPEAFAEIAASRFGEDCAYDPIRRVFRSSGPHSAAAPLTSSMRSRVWRRTLMLPDEVGSVARRSD